jgi:hypothetical protein
MYVNMTGKTPPYRAAFRCGNDVMVEMAPSAHFCYGAIRAHENLA